MSESKTATKRGRKPTSPLEGAFSGRRAPVFARPNEVGAAVLDTEPRYVPEGYRLAWAAVPNIDPTNPAELIEKGYVYATPDMITPNLDKAIKEEMICFPWFNEELHVDAAGRIRYRNMNLMVTKTEWFVKRTEAVYKKVRESVAGAASRVVDESGVRDGGARFENEFSTDTDTIDAE